MLDGTNMRPSAKGGRPRPRPLDEVYRYDGSYQGFLCCVAACCNEKRLPQGIQLLDEPQGTLFGVKAIATDPKLAARVEHSITQRMSPAVRDMVRNGFLTCMEEKELRLIRFILQGYKYGAKVAQMSLNDDVYALNKALLYLKNEAHYHVEFIRFADCGGFLAAMITPNNRVLPLIVSHFCERFNTENFMIFDKNHGMGYVYQTGAGNRGFFTADSVELPEPSEEEARYQELWRLFYDTIAVEGRINPKLRRGHMPMRYWPNMTEFLGRDAVQSNGKV